MKKILAVLTVLLLVGSLLFAGGSKEKPAEAKKFTLRVGHTLTDDSHYGVGLAKLAELAKQKSNGTIEIQAFGNSKLGNERDLIEGVSLGTVEMCLTSTGPLPNFSKAFMVFDLPFIVQDRNKFYPILDGETGQKMLEALGSKGIKGIVFFENGFRHITNSKRPINVPDDLKGLKIRTVETPLDVSTMTYMGAIGTPIAWSECLIGLKQGTVDGISTTYGLGYHLKLYELAKFASQTNHYYETAPLIMSKKLFDSFSPEEQRMIKETAAQALLWSRKEQAKFEGKAQGLLEEKGVKVNSLSQEAFEEFREKTKPVYEQFRPKIGGEFMDEVFAFIKTLRKK